MRWSSAMACAARPRQSTKFTHTLRGWRSARGTKRRRLCGFRSASLADDLVGEVAEALAGCERAAGLAVESRLHCSAFARLPFSFLPDLGSVVNHYYGSDCSLEEAARPDATYLFGHFISAARGTGIAHRGKIQSNGSGTSCRFRLSPLPMKSEHNTIVRHSSMRLPETRAQITQEGHSIRLHN